MQIAHTLLLALSAISAVFAAFFWGWSAGVKTPGGFSIHVIKSQGLAGQAVGGTHIGQGHSPELKLLAEALLRQSQLSRYGAASAALAAAFQGFSIFVSL